MSRYAMWVGYVGALTVGGLTLMIAGGVLWNLLKGLIGWLREPTHYHDRDAFNRLRDPPRRTWLDAESDRHS